MCGARSRNTFTPSAKRTAPYARKQAYIVTKILSNFIVFFAASAVSDLQCAQKLILCFGWHFEYRNGCPHANLIILYNTVL